MPETETKLQSSERLGNKVTNCLRLPSVLTNKRKETEASGAYGLEEDNKNKKRIGSPLTSTYKERCFIHYNRW